MAGGRRVSGPDPRLRPDLGVHEGPEGVAARGGRHGPGPARDPDPAATGPTVHRHAAVGVGISGFFALRSGQAEDAFLPGMLQNAGLLVLLLATNLARWPLFGFVVAVAEPEAFAEDPTWWHKHPGIITVAMRLAWVLIALNVVRLAVMVPLYLAEQVAALGVAKVVLGWPAYLVAITVMGAILLRGHTPIDPARVGPVTERLHERGLRSAVDGDVVETGARGDELLQLRLLLGARDEEQLVPHLHCVVPGRRDRPLVTDDRDEDRVRGPGDVADALTAEWAAVRQGDLDHGGRPCWNSKIRTRSPMLTASSMRAVMSLGVDTATSTPQDSSNIHSFLGLLTRATVRGTPNSVLASRDTTRLALSSPVAATTTSDSSRRASSRALSSQASARSHEASGTLDAWTSSASLSMSSTWWPLASSSRAIERPTLPAPAMTTRI